MASVPRRWCSMRRCAVLLVLALAAAACGGGGDDGETQPQDVQTTETAAPAEPVDDGEEAPAPVDTEPDEREPLLAPVDTTTTTVPSEDGAPAEPEPQFGGTLRVGVEAEGDGLNPAANSFAVSAYLMTDPIFDPVAYWDVHGRWIPYLAESFEPIGDASSWEMKLREGVRFHDGTTLGSEDVVATFEAQLADQIIKLAVERAFVAENRIEVVDEYTVRYNLVEPSAHFPQQVTSQLGMILPSEWLARALADKELNQMPVGTGPFMIESRSRDEVTVLVRNPDYWAADITDIYLDRIELHVITDTVIAAEQVAAGDLDVVVTTNADAILTLQDAGVPIIENVRSSEDFALLATHKPPFNDIRARQALTFATDRDGYVTFIRQGVAPAADSMFHPDLEWNNPDVVQETNSPERAGPLVAEYCGEFPDNCTDGRINIELQYAGPSNQQDLIADLLIDSWDEYFDVKPQELLQDAHITEVALGFYDVATWRQFGAIDPDNDVLWLECRSISGISLNFPRFCSAERDALLYEQRATTDVDRRIEIWREVQAMVRDSYAYIFFNHANWAIGSGENVHNLCGQTSPDGVALFCNNEGRVHLRQAWLS